MPRRKTHDHYLNPTLVSLREAATQQGKKAYWIAFEAELSIPAVADCLNGAVSPTLATLDGVAGALGLELCVRKKR